MKNMKKMLCVLLAGLVILPVSGCARPVEQKLSDAAGPAEIPLEILGELDENFVGKSGGRAEICGDYV